jgi:hypothetical protein
MAGGWQNQEVVLSDKPHPVLYFTTRKIGVIFHLLPHSNLEEIALSAPLSGSRNSHGQKNLCAGNALGKHFSAQNPKKPTPRK